jgi:hypothetical protein
VPIERRKRVGVCRRESKSDVPVRTDHDYAAPRKAGAGGINVGIVRNLDKLRPTALKFA